MIKLAQNIIRVLLGLFGLSLLIIMHEFGHYITCKLFGVRVHTFSIGFGPALFSFPMGETLFRLAILPLGGYVEQNALDLHKLSLLKKLIIILAGVTINLLFAVGVFKYLAYKKQSRESLDYMPEYVEKPMPKTWIKRLIQNAVPDEATSILGQYGNGAVGPFGIIYLMGQTMLIGWDIWLFVLGIISLNLAMFNLLPLPFVDGGQAVNHILESIGHVFKLSPEIIRILYLITVMLTLWILSLYMRRARRHG